MKSDLLFYFATVYTCKIISDWRHKVRSKRLNWEMAYSEMWKEQEVKERFFCFLLAVPTLTSQALEVVLLKVCCMVLLVLCVAVTALVARHTLCQAA